MKKQDENDNDEIISGWYRYAAQQVGFIGFSLRLLRERTGQASEDQRAEFGADEKAFQRLQALPSPRPQSFSKDAHRIAEECGLTNSLAFVRSMIRAQNLERAAGRENAPSAYRAAFDEESDLDLYPEEA